MNRENEPAKMNHENEPRKWTTKMNCENDVRNWIPKMNHENVLRKWTTRIYPRVLYQKTNFGTRASPERIASSAGSVGTFLVSQRSRLKNAFFICVPASRFLLSFLFFFFSRRRAFFVMSFSIFFFCFCRYCCRSFSFFCFRFTRGYDQQNQALHPGIPKYRHVHFCLSSSAGSVGTSLWPLRAPAWTNNTPPFLFFSFCRYCCRSFSSFVSDIPGTRGYDQ